MRAFSVRTTIYLASLGCGTAAVLSVRLSQYDTLSLVALAIQIASILTISGAVWLSFDLSATHRAKQRGRLVGRMYSPRLSAYLLSLASLFLCLFVYLFSSATNLHTEPERGLVGGAGQASTLDSVWTSVKQKAMIIETIYGATMLGAIAVGLVFANQAVAMSKTGLFFACNGHLPWDSILACYDVSPSQIALRIRREGLSVGAPLRLTIHSTQDIERLRTASLQEK